MLTSVTIGAKVTALASAPASGNNSSPGILWIVGVIAILALYQLLRVLRVRLRAHDRDRG
jgi:hypothetical protein